MSFANRKDRCEPGKVIVAESGGAIGMNNSVMRRQA
jgi:hypothetical protein